MEKKQKQEQYDNQDNILHSRQIHIYYGKLIKSMKPGKPIEFFKKANCHRS